MHEKSYRVRQMFDRIAVRYDLLNRLLSAGNDIYWRRVALNRLDAPPDGCLLDLCVGTGDLATGVFGHRQKPHLVVGVDLAVEMMRIGQRKVQRKPHQHVRFVCGNVEELPFHRDTFDGAMIAFGVRNLGDISAGLSNMYQILKPGCRLVVLELSRPRIPGLRQIYQVYFRHILPRVGGIISGDADAYRYLHTSVMAFPSPERFQAMMMDTGFVNTGLQSLSLGIATLYWGEKGTRQGGV